MIFYYFREKYTKSSENITTDDKDVYKSQIGTIARDLGLSPSTIKRALKDLEEKGYLKREIRHRENGGVTSNRYTIL